MIFGLTIFDLFIYYILIGRSNGEKVQVVHNYGHSSHGYQSSWGSSEIVLRLLKDHRLSKL